MLAAITIGNRRISEDGRNFIIGEIGINHNGSVETAKKLIDVASMLGLDAVKFQKRTPELCVPEHQRDVPRETPWGTMSYFDYKKKIEFGEKEFDEIDAYCKSKGILWSASAWDLESLKFLEKYDLPFHKVASAKLTDRELLEEYKKTGKPVLLSTGMSTEEEIKKAVELFGEDYPLAILHCNSGYPAKDEDLNLSYITKLKESFPDKIIGYSGHEQGITASIIAASLGSKIIERHITLDRTMWGTDHAASLEFEGIRRLVRDVHKVDKWLGHGRKEVTETELEVKKKLRDKETL